MPQQLTDMRIQHVSLVDKGANGREFAILKRAGEGPAPMPAIAPAQTEPGLIEKIKALLGVGPVKKARTFADILGGQRIQEAIDDEHIWALRDALWSAVYATDDNGSDLSMDQKQALVAQSLDEFKAYLVGAMSTGIAKGRQAPTEADGINALVRKVGKKISAARMAALREAADKLLAVLAEVEQVSDDEATEKRAHAQEVEMTSEELAAAITKAQEPLLQKIAEIEKRLPAAESKPDGDPVAKAGGDEDDAPAWAVAIVDRIEKLEQGRGQRTSGGGDDAEPVRKNAAASFAGVW